MPRIRNKILAINPGSRYIGFAVFYEHELRDWGIKVVKRKAGQERLAVAIRIISAIIDQNQIGLIAVKALHPSRSSSYLNQFLSGIKLLARRKALKILEYPLSAVESYLGSEQKMNKRNLAEFVSQIYPCLMHELEKENDSLNPYHIRMFEAVALGLTCLKDLKKDQAAISFAMA